MAVNIEMPKLSDTMTEGTVVSWKKSEGDTVEMGDIIAEIETDKATMEMEAFDDGVMAKIFINEGGKAPVGELLAILAEEGESVEDALAGAGSSADAAAPANAPAPEAASAAPAATLASSSDGERVKASPLAKKLADAKGVNIATVQGSGPGGRVLKEDVLSAAANPTPAAAPASAVATPAAAAPAVQAIIPTASDKDKKIPLSSMRKIIADRLYTSKVTIPHFYLHVELDAAPLMDIRKQINAQAEATHGNKYTINDFIMKAVINASMAVPEVNASYAGDHIVQFADVGVSVAIAVEDGLVTPVVKAAQTKSLLQISQEVKDMAKRARDKKLRPDEFDGGTVTVSNLGAYGVESFDAIVNPPQAAIISIGGIFDKPVVKNGEIVPGKVMNLGLSCDHRVVDGAVGATFLAQIKKLIENPALMLV